MGSAGMGALDERVQQMGSAANSRRHWLVAMRPARGGGVGFLSCLCPVLNEHPGVLSSQPLAGRRWDPHPASHGTHTLQGHWVSLLLKDPGKLEAAQGRVARPGEPRSAQPWG